MNIAVITQSKPIFFSVYVFSEKFYLLPLITLLLLPFTNVDRYITTKNQSKHKLLNADFYIQQQIQIDDYHLQFFHYLIRIEIICVVGSCFRVISQLKCMKMNFWFFDGCQLPSNNKIINYSHSINPR